MSGNLTLKKDAGADSWLRQFYASVPEYCRKYWRRYGGIEGLNRWFTKRGRRQMLEAARHLPPLEVSGPESPVEVHFLTGRMFWYQTAFCCYSLMLHSRADLRIVFNDDGTLERRHADTLLATFPAARVNFEPEIEERLDEHLPAERFPVLRRRRLNLKLMRKLTDTHAGTSGWKLFLDSDMLFFRRPDFLLNWLRSPRQQRFYMEDITRAYGYSPELMSTLARGPLPKQMNSGMCGLKSDELDWEQLEAWCAEMIAHGGERYLQEQALSAMLMVKRPCAVAPREDYITVPRRKEVRNPRAVMHHYAGDLKRWYLQFAWKHVLDAAGIAHPAPAAAVESGPVRKDVGR